MKTYFTRMCVYEKRFFINISKSTMRTYEGYELLCRDDEGNIRSITGNYYGTYHEVIYDLMEAISEDYFNNIPFAVEGCIDWEEDGLEELFGTWDTGRDEYIEEFLS